MSDGKTFRVYNPPRPLPEGFRDFDASKVEVGLDGTMQITRIRGLGEKLDIETGRQIPGYEVTLLALIDSEGRLRAETVDADLPDSPPPGVN